MALGIAAVALPIIVAQWRGRRWPLYPGDAMMLGAFGFLLGPIGLAWTMLLGSAFSLAYRVWVQRRRGRRIRKGLVPLGPGMTAGAAVVFLCVNFGVAFAAGEPSAAWRAGRHGNGGHGNGFPLAGYRAGGACSRRRNWPRPAPRCPRQLPLGIWCSNNVTPFPYRLHSVASLLFRASRRRSRSARRGSPAGWRSCPMRHRSAWSGGAPSPVCSTGSRR